MIDIGGSVVVLTRDDATVAAVVGARVGNDDQAVNWDAPMVVVRHISTTRMPGGRGNARIQKQLGRYEALCYGQTRVQAEELARLMTESWHESGIRVGTNGVRIRQAWVDEILGAMNDTGRLKRPYAVVLIDVLAEAQPL